MGRQGRRRKQGQAIVELVVGLVVVVVLLGCILQIGTLGLAHTRALISARRDAGIEAMQARPVFSGAHYIRDVTVGLDQSAYSRDDDYTPAYVGDFTDGIVLHANPDLLDRHVPGNRITALARSTMPQVGFGLVHGQASEVVPLLPVVRNLIYGAEEIEVTADAWLTWTEGIY